MLLEEADQMLPWDTAILRSRDTVSAESTRIKPFAHGSWCYFADLGDLSSREDRSHRGLSNHLSVVSQKGVATLRIFTPRTAC